MTFPHWHNFTEFTPVIPALYWDVESEEQRTKALCKQLCKLINYAAKMGIAIDELQQMLEDIEAGKLDPIIFDAIEEWFAENQPALQNDVNNLKEIIPADNFSSNNTVSDAITDLATSFNDDLSQAERRLNDSIDATNDNVSALQTSINNIWHENSRYAGKNIVFLGDSYSAPDIPNSEYEWFPTHLANILGMTKFNYAYGGAGFARPTNLISTQQTRASNDMTSEQKANTALVCCVAGCNDILNLDSQSITQADIVAGINNFISWANTTYPNAKVILVPFNWGFSKLTAQINRLITNCLNSINTSTHGKGILLITGAWLWNLGIVSRFRNEVHPNYAGYAVILNHVLNALAGSPNNDYSLAGDITITNENISTSQAIRYNVINGIVNLYGFIRPVNAQVGYGSQIDVADQNTLPAIVTPNNSLVVIPLTSSTTGRHIGIFGIRNNGSAYVRFFECNANEVGTFSYSFPAEVGVNWSDYI